MQGLEAHVAEPSNLRTRMPLAASSSQARSAPRKVGKDRAGRGRTERARTCEDDAGGWRLPYRASSRSLARTRRTQRQQKLVFRRGLLEVMKRASTTHSASSGRGEELREVPMVP